VRLPPGYTSRPATPDDLDDVAALFAARDMAYHGESQGNRAMLQYEWAAAWLEIEHDTRTIRDAGDTLVAYAQNAAPDPAVRFETRAAVHPSSEGGGLGSAILDWVELETRARLGPGSETRVWNATAVRNAGAIRLFEAYGYEPIRTFWQMTIELDPSFDMGAVPDGVTIRPLGEGADARAAFAVLNAAFASHFGYIEESFEEWWAQQIADETWDPALGLVAELEGEIVGAANNGVIEGTGWVFELGVFPERQGRGIGKALLRRSLAMFADRGLRIGRLGVDTENATGAVELYRSVGMVPIREERVFEKRLKAD
jgi:mycothiol synthase